MFRAPSDGGQVAAVVATVAGVVIKVTAGLFAVQSARSVRHLESQASHLRDDVRQRQMVEQAEEVIARIGDDARRDELRAQIVFSLLGGKTPGPDATR